MVLFNQEKKVTVIPVVVNSINITLDVKVSSKCVDTVVQPRIYL